MRRRGAGRAARAARAIEIPKGREADTGLIVDAAAAAVTARGLFDPGLLAVL